jgi:glycosyltransferase involved in cell wall biosynthesis
MENPKISVVTPSFNQGPYIEDAIRSVAEQGYPNYEHIIIDNCSTDETAEIASRYPNIIFISEPDEGQSDALNKGFKRASGDIICWLNADDYYMPGTFQKAVEVLSDPRIDGIYGNTAYVNQNKEYVRTIYAHRPSKWLALLYTFIHSTTVFFRRRILDEGIFIDKSYHLTMDQEFFAHILFKGFKFRYVNQTFASFRWHEDNKSRPNSEVNIRSAAEGLATLNKYSGFKLAVNSLTIRLYRVLFHLSKVYRRMLIYTEWAVK